MKHSYKGRVVDVNDPKKIGRIKVAVESMFDEIDIEDIPWALSRNTALNRFDLPPLNAMVNIEFLNENINRPVWYTLTTGKEVTFSESDYPTAAMLFSKDLSEYESEGSINMTFTESEGFKIIFEYGEQSNIFNLKPDNSISLHNLNTDKQIHISNESISLGSENSSAEPSVLGDKNKQALEGLNDTIKSLFGELNTQIDNLKIVTSSSPYTAHLQAPLSIMKTAIKTKTTALYNENNNIYPKTLSSVVTLD